jgi:mannitol/fructose-specific phosphotransferase system IIA component (Ntr-type)
MAIALADLLDEKLVDLDLRARTAESAIRKISGLLKTNEKIRDPEKFVERVLAREQASPSAVEHGVAFPHARTDVVENLVLGIGRSRLGVLFAKENERAHLIFLIGVPQRLVNDYLVCVGALARILNVFDKTTSRLLRRAVPAAFQHKAGWPR